YHLLLFNFYVIYSFSCFSSLISSIFFFNDPATTEIYTLSLHDALPISAVAVQFPIALDPLPAHEVLPPVHHDAVVSEKGRRAIRSEEHTSELQSQSNLVCRLLLEKKKKKKKYTQTIMKNN